VYRAMVFLIPNKIQSREYSKGGDTGGMIYIRNSDGNLYVRYLNWNGDQWNWNYNWLDNDFNSSNPAILRATFFISLLQILWESFVLKEFFQAILPTFYRPRLFFLRLGYSVFPQVSLFPKES